MDLERRGLKWLTACNAHACVEVAATGEPATDTGAFEYALDKATDTILIRLESDPNNVLRYTIEEFKNFIDGAKNDVFTELA